MATYYVAATGGNDANTGLSWAQAFATIAHALTVIASGDAIELSAGTHSPAAASTALFIPDVSALTINGQGESSTTIAFTYFGSGDAGMNIQGSLTLTNLTITSNPPGANAEYPVFISNSGSANLPCTVTLQNVTINGVSDCVYASSVGTASTVIVKDCTLTSHADAFVIDGDGTELGIVENSSITCTFNSTWNFQHGIATGQNAGGMVVVFGCQITVHGGSGSPATGVYNQIGNIVVVNSTITVSGPAQHSIINSDGASTTFCFGATFDRSKVLGTLSADTTSGSGGLTPTQANVLANLAATFGATDTSTGTATVPTSGTGGTNRADAAAALAARLGPAPGSPPVANVLPTAAPGANGGLATAGASGSTQVDASVGSSISSGTVGTVTSATVMVLTKTAGRILDVGDSLTFTSGNAQGHQVTLASFAAGAWTVTWGANDMPVAPSNGDTWSVSQAATQGQASGLFAAIAALPQTVTAIAAAIWAFGARTLTAIDCAIFSGSFSAQVLKNAPTASTTVTAVDTTPLTPGCMQVYQYGAFVIPGSGSPQSFAVTDRKTGNPIDLSGKHLELLATSPDNEATILWKYATNPASGPATLTISGTGNNIVTILDDTSTNTQAPGDFRMFLWDITGGLTAAVPEALVELEILAAPKPAAA